MSENLIPHSIDEDKIRRAVRLFLDGIGEDPDREGLLDTPDRVARMCHEIFAGLGQDAEPHLSKVFNTESSGLVIERNTRFYSLCEHHLMPFWNKVSGDSGTREDDWRYAGFLYLDDKGMPLAAMHREHRFNRIVTRYNEICRLQIPGEHHQLSMLSITILRQLSLR